MNWRSPLLLSLLGLLLAAVVLALGVRRHSFSVELVDEYTGAGEEDAEEEPQPLE